MNRAKISRLGLLPVDLHRIKRAFLMICRVDLILLPLPLCSCGSCADCGGDGKDWGKCNTCGGTGQTPLSVGVFVLLTIAAIVVLVILMQSPAVRRFFAGSGQAPESLARGGRPTVGRQVVVIGLEGAGKTTFLATLSRFANLHPEKLVLELGDYEFSKYIVKALETLERGEWPISNPQGSLEICRWQIGRPRKALHEVIFFDYSGQDMQAVLRDNDGSSLEGRPKELRDIVDGADLLIYLFDFESLIRSGSLSDINDNFWFLRTVLTRRGWMEKHRILAATKADFYSELIAGSGRDFGEAITLQLSGIPGGGGLGRHFAGMKCFTVSRALTWTTLDEKSEQIESPERLCNRRGSSHKSRKSSRC